MKNLRILTAAILLFCSGTPLVYSQGAGIEWDALNQQVMDLYRQGNYDRAAVVAQRALEVAEQNLGPDHPDVANSLNNLADLYRATNRIEEAEKLQQRTAQIRAMKR